MEIKALDILFVSNFSFPLNETEKNIALHLPESIKYENLTYRKTDIKNSLSYESFLLNNFDYIDDYPIEEIQKKFQDINLYLAFVSERLISNYYFGIEKTLGNKDLTYSEIMFLIKSFVLFLSPYIENSKIVFSGYADNFMSTLTYYLCDHFDKKCIAFHEISVINSDSNFLIEGLYAKPYQNLIINEKTKSYDELIEFMRNYDGAKDRDERAKKNKTMKKGFFGVFSPNIFDMDYLKFALFGYQVSDSRIKVYMNIDRPSIDRKLKANISRVYNRFVSSKFVKKVDFKQEKNTKYIYFPLQIQPEASTSARVPFYMNQLATIENISKSLPLGYKLITKEHPLAIGMNGIDFYQKINSIPNVEFVNNKISGKEIVQIADLIISFGGTTLFESILEGKKVLMLLPDYIYCDSPLIFKVKDKNDLYSDIIKALNFTMQEDDIRIEKDKMLNFFYQRGFSRFIDFEKNMADNLMRIYEMEKENE